MAATARHEEYHFHDQTVGSAVLNALLSQKENDGTFCDVTMRVCGREIRAHSNVLASVSPYFASFFSSDLPRGYSQRSPQMIEIMVDDSGPEMSVDLGDAVNAVVNFIYSGSLQINPSNVAHIAEIARVMQIDSVSQFCDDFTASRLSGNRTNHVYRRNIDVSDAAVATEPDWSDYSPVLLLPSSAPAASNRSASGHKGGRAVQCVSVSTQVFPSLLGISLDSNSKESLSSDVESLRPVKATCPGVDADVKSKGANRNASADDRLRIPAAAAAESGQDLEAVASSSCGKQARMLSVLRHGVQCSSSVSVRHSQRLRRRSVKLAESSESFRSLSSSGRRGRPLADRQINGEIHRSSVGADPSGNGVGDASELSGNADKSEMAVERCDAPVMTTFPVTVAEGVAAAAAAGSVNGNSLLPLADVSACQNGVFALHKFNCSVCGFATNNVRKMSAHTRDHKLANNVCFYCERGFDSSEALDEHIKNDHPVDGAVSRPFSCAECGVWFRSHGQLAAHLPKHSAKRPFVCDTCGATFKWRNALRNHAVTHSTSKEHLCDVCGYATAHRAQMRAHRLVHTGDTLRCPWEGCEYRAIRLQNLKYHALTHTQEKAHQCEFCGQSFSLHKNMKRHMLLHMDSAKKHKCPRCDFSTLRFDKLKDHLHKQHNVGSAPERRMRITDLVNQSQSNDLPAQQQSQAATASDGSGVVPGAEAKLPASPSSAQGVMYADSLQMVQLPEGMTLVNGGVSLMSAPEGHTIAILQDQAIVLRPSAEFVSPADFPPLQLIALGGDEQTVVSGIAQALVNETVGSCIVKDESEPCHFVV